MHMGSQITRQPSSRPPQPRAQQHSHRQSLGYLEWPSRATSRHSLASGKHLHTFHRTTHPIDHERGSKNMATAVSALLQSNLIVHLSLIPVAAMRNSVNHFFRVPLHPTLSHGDTFLQFFMMVVPPSPKLAAVSLILSSATSAVATVFVPLLCVHSCTMCMFKKTSRGRHQPASAPLGFKAPLFSMMRKCGSSTYILSQ